MRGTLLMLADLFRLLLEVGSLLVQKLPAVVAVPTKLADTVLPCWQKLVTFFAASRSSVICVKNFFYSLLENEDIL